MCNSVQRIKNSTVSESDELYRAARIRAAKRGTWVSAIVSDYLTRFAESGARFSRLEEQLRQIVSGIDRFSAIDRLDRLDLHDRELGRTDG